MRPPSSTDTSIYRIKLSVPGVANGLPGLRMASVALSLVNSQKMVALAPAIFPDSSNQIPDRKSEKFFWVKKMPLRFSLLILSNTASAVSSSMALSVGISFFIVVLACH